MASVSADARGNRVVQFTGPDRKRRTLRLGKAPKKIAEQVKGMVERLNAAKLAGHAPDDHTARWFAGLGDALHGRLAAAGLVAPRSAVTVADFAAQYAASRTDVKPATRDHLRRCADALAAFFGPDKALRDVTAGDADDYRLAVLAGGNCENTVRRRVGRAKQVFHAAVRKELIVKNPFADQRVQVRGNPAKFRRFGMNKEPDRHVGGSCPS